MSDQKESDSSTESITVERRAVGNFLAGGVTGTILTWGGMKSLGDGTSTVSEQSTPSSLQLKNRPYMGDRSGTATMVYYTDFQCPFCKQFEAETLPKIVNNYDRNELHLVIKPIGELAVDSKRAALAAHCAWEQLGNTAEYWEFYKALGSLYEPNTDSGWAKTENLTPLAEEFDGLDAERFQACHSQQEHRIRTVDDKQEATEFGMSGTPFFIIYGDDLSEARTISGAQPYSRFQTVINQYLE